MIIMNMPSGTPLDSTNAAAADIRLNKTAYDGDSGEIITGSMPDVSPNFDGGTATINASSTSATASGLTISDTDTDPGSGIYITTAGTAQPKRAAVLYNGEAKGYINKADNTTALGAADGASTNLTSNKYYVTKATIPASKSLAVEAAGTAAVSTSSATSGTVTVNAYNSSSALTGAKTVASGGKWNQTTLGATSASGTYYGKVDYTQPTQQTDSGNVTLNDTTTSKSYPAGYYANAHGATHVTVDIPDPTMTFNASTNKVTANGSWTKGFTTDSSYTNDYTVTLDNAKNVTGTATLNNAETSGTTYTEITNAATVIPANGALYINKGYIGDSKITLSHLIPDPESGKENVGAAQMRTGYVAYDGNGAKIVGTMADVTPTFTGGAPTLTSKSNTITPSSNITTASSGDYYIDASASAKATRTAVTYSAAATGYINQASGNTASAAATEGSAETISATRVYLKTAEASKTDATASASITKNPSASASMSRTGNIGSTTAPTSGTEGTDYWKFTSSSSASSGVATASVTASSASVTAGYSGGVSTSTNATSATTTEASASNSATVYLSKATLGSEGSVTTAPSVAVGGTTNMTTATSGTYYFTRTATPSNGSVQTKYKATSAGYIPTVSATNDGTVTVTPSTSGTGTVYIPTAGLGSEGSVATAPSVAVGCITNMSTTTSGTYYITTKATPSNGSVQTKYKATSAGYTPAVSATNGGTVTVTPGTSGTGTVYIPTATITNNTSGGTSTGTISSGKQIKIAAGYNPSDVYYTAENGKVGTATSAQVLSGYTFTNAGSIGASGGMTNQGAGGTTLNCGESYTINAGYYNGSGKVTANSLASQTVATATASNILNGATAWVNGSKLTGTMACTYNASTLTLSIPTGLVTVS